MGSSHTVAPPLCHKGFRFFFAGFQLQTWTLGNMVNVVSELQVDISLVCTTSGCETTENAVTPRLVNQRVTVCDTWRNNEFYSLGSRYKKHPAPRPPSANAVSAEWIHQRRC